MSNALYDWGRDAFANGNIDWVNDTIKAVLVDTAAYTVDLANDQYITDIPSGEQVAEVALTSKSTSAGVCDAADATFTLVSGDQSEAIVLYKDTGTPSTSPLIAYIDTATGLPITPSGGDIVIEWDNGANKIFKL
jgi:hypothetical protein